MFALYFKTKIKFDYGYVVLENLLFEFYAGLGTIKVSQMSLCVTTCGEFGFNGENRSPLGEARSGPM